MNKFVLVVFAGVLLGSSQTSAENEVSPTQAFLQKFAALKGQYTLKSKLDGNDAVPVYGGIQSISVIGKSSILLTASAARDVQVLLFPVSGTQIGMVQLYNDTPEHSWQAVGEVRGNDLIIKGSAQSHFSKGKEAREQQNAMEKSQFEFFKKQVKQAIGIDLKEDDDINVFKFTISDDGKLTNSANVVRYHNDGDEVNIEVLFSTEIQFIPVDDEG